MSVLVDGSSLTIADVVNVARHRHRVELPPKQLNDIVRCRQFYEGLRHGSRPIYGVTTGVGSLSTCPLATEELEEFQANMLRSHAAGVGEPAPIEFVRGAMLSKANVHARGKSACRPEVTQTFLEMLNREVTPVVCLRGSVSACGDLAPMAQLALLLMGEGEAYFKGERLPGAVAMRRAEIPIPGVKDRDGLAAINGSNFITAIFALQLYDIEVVLRHAEVACAMAMEALGANVVALDARLHAVRGFPGGLRSAQTIRDQVAGGDLTNGVDAQLQDAYSLRATPQVLGAVWDALEYCRAQIEIELNAVADNPIFFPDEADFLTGANFQGFPVSLPMDLMATALTSVCVMSERRLNRLLNPALSRGLPAFLSPEPGKHNGLMISQYTAGALVAEQRLLSSPASIGSIPACADQEDFVSMGMNAALRNMQLIANAHGVIGIELMAAAQAMDLCKRRFGAGSSAAHAAVRSKLPKLERDRELHRDHAAMIDLIKSEAILDAVRSATATEGLWQRSAE